MVARTGVGEGHPYRPPPSLPSRLKNCRTSLIVGLIGKKLTAPCLFDGTCDTDTFNAWLGQQLLPQLAKGTIIVIDNAAFHKSAATREMVDDAGCQILFLPPYSPDLMPIEKRFGNIKRYRKYNPDMPIDQIVRVYG